MHIRQPRNDGRPGNSMDRTSQLILLLNGKRNSPNQIASRSRCS